MKDLVEWLSGQVDDADADARACLEIHGPGEPVHEYAQQTLRDNKAKRQILNLTRFDAQFPDSEGGYDSACEDVIKLLAEGYDQRPGYQEAWRP